MAVADYRAECLKFLGAPYLLGGEDTNGTDCSGILRAYFNLEFTANDFLQRLYIHETGQIGAVFLIDDEGFAYHVMPEVGHGVVLDATTKHGVILRAWDNGILRYI